MLKIKRSILIFYLFMIGYYCKAQTLHCVYSTKQFAITGINSKSSNYYTCDLSTKQSAKTKIVTIYGDHQPLFSDRNVQLLHILKDSQLEVFSFNICNKFENLEVIWTEDENIKSIGQLSSKSCSNLEHLEMTGNEIREIPSGAFKFQVKLLELALPYNKIQVLHSDSFDRLENVKTLNLQFNEISDLPEKVFAPMKNLLELNLSDNKLTTIHKDSFGDQDEFISLFLMRNQISSIDPEFISTIAIYQLYIKENICTSSSFITSLKSEIQDSLAECFTNYKPRQSNRVVQSAPKIFEINRSILPPKLPSAYRQAEPTFISTSTQLPKIPEESAQYNIQRIKTVFNQNLGQNATKKTCGKPITGHGDIIGGKKTVRGNFPWMAALVFSVSGKFFCGGNLVTNRKVLTAAHCIQEKHTSKPTLAREFLVLLGVYDLNKPFEAGRNSYAVQSVNLHPDWNIHTEAYDADIAVLVLDSEVFYNNYIQPVCIVHANTNFAALTNGIVVGYGRSEDVTKIHENIPKVLDTPIHTHQKCFSHNDVLKRISSGRTICGGTGNGIGVCNGDSGSGLYVTDGIYYSIRGIVSSSVIGGQYGCDVNTFSVFTDVTKYIDWINGIQTSRFV